MRKQTAMNILGALIVGAGITAACVYASYDQRTKIPPMTVEATEPEETEAPTLSKAVHDAPQSTQGGDKPGGGYIIVRASKSAPVPAESDLVDDLAEPETTELLPETVDPETVIWQANDQHEVPKARAFSPTEKDMLARIARAECGGESIESMACIICVVLNRVDDPHFPNSIQAVIEAPGQFKPVASGEYYQPASDKAWAAVELVCSGYDPSYGATYFSTGRSSWHWNNLQYLGTFGKIYLYHEWEV